MLTEEQRAAIELEESYREAVRQQIRESESKNSHKSIWAMLNAPFVLFILSSVVLTGITSLGTWLFATIQEDTAAKQAETKLYADAAYRIAKIDATVTKLLGKYEVGADRDKSFLDVLNIYRALNEVDNQPIFTEFRDRNLQSLLWELLARNKDEVKLRSAFQASIGLVAHKEQKWDANINFSDGVVRYDGRGTTIKNHALDPDAIAQNLRVLNDEILPALRWITTTKAPFDPNKAFAADR